MFIPFSVFAFSEVDSIRLDCYRSRLNVHHAEENSWIYKKSGTNETDMRMRHNSLHWTQTHIILLQHLYIFCSKSKQNPMFTMQNPIQHSANKQTKNDTHKKNHWNCLLFTKSFSLFHSLWFTKEISITYQFFSLRWNSLVGCFEQISLWNSFCVNVHYFDTFFRIVSTK